MTQHIRKAHDVSLGPVEGGGEQVPQVVGEHLARLPPAALHSRLSSNHTCRREMPLPLHVRKISPAAVFCFLAYFTSLRHSLAGSKIVRILA